MTDAGIVIRPATVADLDEIEAIEKLSFSDPWSGASFVGLLRGTRTRMNVAVENGRVLGYGILLLAPPDADLANLAVAPTARRKGVGRRLLADVLASARVAHVHDIYLEVRESNERAITLYEHAGFTDVGRRRRYYRDPIEDAKVLRLTLSADRFSEVRPDAIE